MLPNWPTETSWGFIIRWTAIKMSMFSFPCQDYIISIVCFCLIWWESPVITASFHSLTTFSFSFAHSNSLTYYIDWIVCLFIIDLKIFFLDITAINTFLLYVANIFFQSVFSFRLRVFQCVEKFGFSPLFPLYLLSFLSCLAITWLP